MQETSKRRGKIVRPLSRQVREAVEIFVQHILDHPDNDELLNSLEDKDRLASRLWNEGLIVAYRLLFLLKLESFADPSESFPFIGAAQWKEEFSPGSVLAPLARGSETDPSEGCALEERLRALFRLLAEGSTDSEATIPAMGSTLFGNDHTSGLDGFRWGEAGVATLLDRLVWIRSRRGVGTSDRIAYRDLEAEDLGRVYETLFQLEPGIASEPMCRLSNWKREMVVPIDQGERYRETKEAKVRWIEEIPPGRFYLKSGLGRKSTGTFYTPTPLVHLLVRETLGAIVDARSPADHPRPSEILRIRLLDPATGSGHFLLEACRFLGQKLLAAIRSCVAQGIETELSWVVAGRAESVEVRERLCRTLVAAHCLYGIDKNPLAIELTRLALWLEAAVPGHEKSLDVLRLLAADFLTLPRFEELMTMPGSGEPIDPELAGCLREIATDSPKSIATFLEVIAPAWVGGVMLGTEESDDEAYVELLQDLVWKTRADSDGLVRNRPSLRRMTEEGRGNVPFELRFPEAFEAHDEGGRPPGFDAIIGNPPWDKLRVESRELLGETDPVYLSGKESAGTRGSRQRLATHEHRGSRADAFVAYYLGINRLIRRVYPPAAWRGSSNVDAYRAFVARATQVQSKDGRLGFVVGSAFAKTVADAPLRRFLFDEQGSLVLLMHFINTNRQFEFLPSVIEFSAFVQSRSSTVEPVRMMFDIDHMDIESALKKCIKVSQRELSRMLRESGTIIPRLRGMGAEAMRSISEVAASFGISFGIDISRTHDGERQPLAPLRSIIPDADDARELSVRAALLERGYVPAYTGKSMRIYEDFPVVKMGKWNPEVVLVGDLDHPRVEGCLGRMGYYRLAYRSTPGSPQTNERSFQIAMLPPGVLATNSVHPEREPERRSNAHALIAMAILNSLSADAAVRPHVTSNINQALLDVARIPSPEMTPGVERFLVHSALRLSAAHEQFRDLWREQLPRASRAVLDGALPTVNGNRERLELRCAVDATVAHLFRLEREVYGRILAQFRHKENPETPNLCLARFGEIRSIGIDAFGRSYDPYWEIELSESLPAPATLRPPGRVV